MTMDAVCPVCGNPQAQGLMDDRCTTILEKDLAEVRALMGELDVTISKQAKIGGGAKGGPARERTPVNWGAVAVADDLTNTLTTWARDVGGSHVRAGVFVNPTRGAVSILLMHIDAIRRHPAANELFDEITDAIKQARRAIDRPQDRVYLGVCLVPTPDEEGRDVTCLEEIYASPTARFAVCKVCGMTHDVAERQQDLLDRAEDMLFTVQEAAQMVGSYGSLSIGESTIRGYVSTGQISYHGKVAGSSVIRLGDLMKVIATNATKPTRKLRRAV